jgi:thiamine biosynthesis lipoprotein
MLTTVHQFYAMGSDCAVHLCVETAADFEQIAGAAEAEIRRIECRYSRYRNDSELARINRVAANGGSIEIDAETGCGLDSLASAPLYSRSGIYLIGYL